MTQKALNELQKKLIEANGDDVEVEGLSHVALFNIERRVRSYFGVEYGINIESTENVGTKVTIRLPLRERGL